MTRLINQVDVLQRLLAAVAAVPIGERLHIPALRDALVNQADVLAGLQLLIAAGELDPGTLRPPLPGQPNHLEATLAEMAQAVRPPLAEKPSGDDLATALTRYAAAHRLSLTRIGEHLFKSRSAISRLRSRASVQQKTIDRVQSFLAAPPVAELANQPSGGPRVAQVGDVTGAGLAAELDALIAREGLSKTAVGLHLANNRSWIEVLRMSNPRQATVEKVHAFLAEPPPEKLRAITPAASSPDCRRGGVADAKAPPPPPEFNGYSGADLAAQIDAMLLSDPTISKSAVGKAIAQSSGGVENLRRTKRPGQTMIDRVRAVLADPPRLQRAKRAPDPVIRAAAIHRANSQSAAKLLDRESAGEKVANVSPAVRAAANEIKHRRECEARQTDPVERAKLTLQRQGRRVFSATVSDGPDGEGFFYVGSKRVSEAELLFMAGETIDVKTSPAPPLQTPARRVAMLSRPTSMLPAELAWCDQCDQRVSGARVAKCQSQFCSLKKADAA